MTARGWFKSLRIGHVARAALAEPRARILAAGQAAQSAEVRIAALLEAADLLDSIARTQDCFDDAEMQAQSLETGRCANAVRVYAKAARNHPANPTSQEG